MDFLSKDLEQYISEDKVKKKIMSVHKIVSNLI